MTDKGELVVTSQYQREVTKWLLALKRKESVSVLFFPETDRMLRCQQLLQDKIFMQSVLGTQGRFLFQLLDFEAHNVEDRNEMCMRIADQMNYSGLTPDKMNWTQWMEYLRSNNVTLVLILPRAEKFLTPATSHVLSYLSHIIDTFSPTVISLCLFEADITHPTYTRLLPESRLLQHIHYYPLYSVDDSRQFIFYLGKKWDTPISNALANKIIDACGGNFWLIKETVRQLASGETKPFIQEGIQFRLRTIYNLLLPSEQSVLAKITAHKKITDAAEQASLRYFQKMNVVDQHGRCLVGLFEEFLTTETGMKGEFIEQDGKILLNGVPVNRMFSPNERRVMKLLLSKKGEMTSRDEIAAVLWPTNTADNYSDWAIDQIIARLRKRFSELSLPPTLLKAVRGKGYLLRLLSP